MRLRNALLLGVGIICGVASLVNAGNFQIKVPVRCTLGVDCYIQQYVDQDPGPGATDYLCGSLSYQGHKGTDIGLPDLAAMTRGVKVVAAAPGTVRGIRDGMADRYFEQTHAEEIKGRDCGNGVVISHGGGWETQYCHLKQGSVTVQSGEKVRMGQVLGQVGLSGRTQFPHLHLSVRKDGEVIDPFDPGGEAQCGRDATRDLWLKTPPTREADILRLDFDNEVPSFAAVKAGETTRADLTQHSPALVIYSYAFGGQKDDRIALILKDPNGDILVDHTARLEKNQALFLRAAGLRRKTTLWPSGIYTAHTVLLRNGREIATRTETLILRR